MTSALTSGKHRKAISVQLELVGVQSWYEFPMAINIRF